jgi:hypothetical protein
VGRARGPVLSGTRLAWLQATSRRRWAVSLWLCLAVAFAVPALLPLIEAIGAESALTQTLDQNGSLTVQRRAGDVGAFSAFERGVEGTMTARVGAKATLLTASAAVGPVFGIAVNGGPARTLPSRGGVTPTYLDHLSSHVSVVAGELPADGLGGGATAVTMPQAGADQLGLHLSDRFCLQLTGVQQPSWCARLVGLWQPTDPDDPYWGGSPPRMQLTMGRYDFFQMMSLSSPQQALASLRYQANPGQIDTREAPAFAEQVRQLSSQLRRSGLHVVTSLSRELERFVATQRTISFTTRLVAATAALLGLLVVGLASARFLDGQSHDLGVLRARGWSRRRTWQLAFAGPAALAALALPAGLAGCVAVAAAASSALPGTSALPLRLWDLAGPAAAVGASVLGVVVVLVLSAARAAPPEAEASPQRPFRRRRPGWWAAFPTVLLGVVGGGAVALQRLPGFDQVSSALPGSVLGYLPAVPAVGLLLLAAALVRLRPFRAFAPGRHASVSGLLAAKQLERRPQQHTTLALVLVLSAATGVFAVVAFVIQLTQGPSEPQAVRAGAEAGLLAGALGTLALALVAFAFHFRWAARRRLGEYGGLFAHGLPAPQVSRSLATEQRAVTWSSVLGGGIVGAAVALATLPTAGTSSTTFEAAALAAGAFLAGFLACTVVVGSLVRRMPARVNPLPDPWLQ